MGMYRRLGHAQTQKKNPNLCDQQRRWRVPIGDDIGQKRQCWSEAWWLQRGGEGRKIKRTTREGGKHDRGEGRREETLKGNRKKPGRGKGNIF